MKPPGKGSQSFQSSRCPRAAVCSPLKPERDQRRSDFPSREGPGWYLVPVGILSPLVPCPRRCLVPVGPLSPLAAGPGRQCVFRRGRQVAPQFQRWRRRRRGGSAGWGRGRGHGTLRDPPPAIPRHPPTSPPAPVPARPAECTPRAALYRGEPAAGRLCRPKDLQMQSFIQRYIYKYNLS